MGGARFFSFVVTWSSRIGIIFPLIHLMNLIYLMGTESSLCLQALPGIRYIR